MKQAIAIGKGVQFNGPEQVLSAYTSRDLPAFALWCGKQFLYTYEEADIEGGAEALQGWLDNLKDSAATYTLTVYKYVPEDGITAQTPYHGSFNFKLQDKPVTYLGGAYGQVGGNWQHLVKELEELRTENKALKAEVADLEADLEALEKEGSKGVVGHLGSMATEVLKSEVVQNTIAESIAGWLGRLIAPAVTGQPKALAGGELLQWQMKINDSEAAEVNNALNVLFAVEGIQVPALLSMLANLAKKDQQQFLTYVQMFSAMAK